MKEPGPKVSDLTALELISRLPDDTPLTTSEAAVFVRESKSSMEKMRRPGAKKPGPRYAQGGSSTSEGSNQKVVYFKGDLKAWLRSNYANNTLEAAVNKGQLRNIEPVAFWTTPEGSVEEMVEDTAVDVLFERIGSWGVKWMLPEEAAIMRASGYRVVPDD
jgi:hypothetical protein